MNTQIVVFVIVIILVLVFFMWYNSGKKDALKDEPKEDDLMAKAKQFDFAAAQREWNMSAADFINMKSIIKYQPSRLQQFIKEKIPSK